MLAVGFIGLGFISGEHVRGYFDQDGARIVAVCNSDAAAGAAWQAKWKLGEARNYVDYREMLAREDLDIVEVLTPHRLHCEMVEACAKAGVRGISVQKPMGLGLGQADRMIAACRENSAKLRVYENAIFHPVYAKAKSLLDEGIIGPPATIRSHTIVGVREGAGLPPFWRAGAWRSSADSAGLGPIVGDHGYHRFSVVSWLAGTAIDTLGCWIDEGSPLDCPGLIRARFKTAPGRAQTYAQIDFTFMRAMASPCDFWLDDFVEVVGESGVLWVNQCDGAGDRDIYKDLEMSSSPLFPPIKVFVDGKVSTYLTELTPAERNWSTSFVASTRDFIEAMVHDREPIQTGEQAKEIKRYMIAAYLSAIEKRDVRLDEVTSEAEASGDLRMSTNFCN